MSVPVKNIYYLLCYAWQRFEAKDSVVLDAIPGNRIENLLGQVLRVEVGRLFRGGLDRGYIARQEVGRQLRGKVLLIETMQRLLLQQGRIACERDDFSRDVPHNRAIKAAMRALIAVPTLDATIRHDLMKLCFRFEDVSDVELSPLLLRQVQLHRNIARYAFLINIARLIERCLLPEPGTGARRFHPFTASDQEMGLLFQAFIFNFLRREQHQFRLAAPKIKWDVECATISEREWLPDMNTDIVLTSQSRRIVIETKYYAMPYQQFLSGSKKLISVHLYQLMSYVSHMAVTEGPKPIGVLLYAGDGPGASLRYRLNSYTILVRNIDLNRDWPEIHRSLLDLVDELGGTESPLGASPVRYAPAT